MVIKGRNHLKLASYQAIDVMPMNHSLCWDLYTLYNVQFGQCVTRLSWMRIACHCESRNLRKFKVHVKRQNICTATGFRNCIIIMTCMICGVVNLQDLTEGSGVYTQAIYRVVVHDLTFSSPPISWPQTAQSYGCKSKGPVIIYGRGKWSQKQGASKIFWGWESGHRKKIEKPMRQGTSSMVEHSLTVREVPGSIPGQVKKVPCLTLATGKLWAWLLGDNLIST